MNIPGGAVDLVTSAGVGTLAVVGGVAKGAQWRDMVTGKFSWGLMASGIATSLVMATVVRAAGSHYGVEPWVQVAGSGVLCYVGADPILRAIANMALKRYGINDNGDPGNGKKP